MDYGDHHLNYAGDPTYYILIVRKLDFYNAQKV